jgi:hypothetical protein
MTKAVKTDFPSFPYCLAVLLALLRQLRGATMRVTNILLLLTFENCYVYNVLPYINSINVTHLQSKLINVVSAHIKC